MSRFLRKLREFIVGTEEGEEFPPTLPMADEVRGKFAYKGTLYLYEGTLWDGRKIYYTDVRELTHTTPSNSIARADTCIGKTSVTFLLDQEIDYANLHLEGQQPAAHGNWLQALKSGVEKREALIKRVGREYE